MRVLAGCRTVAVAAVLAVAVVQAGCSPTGSGETQGGGSTAAAPAEGAPAAESAAPVDEAPTLPPGATPGLDDFNGDGMPDPFCGTQDYGAGLVLRLLCNQADYASPPTDGTTLVPNSMYGFPGLDVDQSAITGSALQARDVEGRKLAMILITSDTLFATGSATLSDPAKVNFEAIARMVQGNWPNASIRVRGHTDATGSPANNQRLSEARAKAAADYLGTQGINPSLISSAGLGPTVPIVLETNPDGSDNPTGREYNRRVEFIVTTA